MGRKRRSVKVDGSGNGVRQGTNLPPESTIRPKPVARKKSSTANKKRAEGYVEEQRRNEVSAKAEKGTSGVRSGQKSEKAKKKRSRRILWVLPVFAIIVLIAVLLLRGCSADLERVIIGMPEFEESIAEDGSKNENGERINLAVVPDFVVSKDRKSFPLPYPEENSFDVEFSFLDENMEEVYHTKRLRPGTIASIPAYDFCEEGEHKYRINVEVYDKDNYKPVQSAVALEMKFT